MRLPLNLRLPPSIYQWISLVTLSCVIALGLGIDLQIPVVVLLAPIGIVVFLGLVVESSSWKAGGWLLASLGAASLLGNYLSTAVPRGGGVFADLWVMLAAVVALPTALACLRTEAILKRVLLLYCGYLLFAAASTVIHHSKLSAGIYQLLYNFKLPAMLLTGLAITWTEERQLVARRVILASLVISLIAVAVETIAPGLYRVLARGTAELSATPNPLLHGLISRKSGPYIHSGALASFSSFSGCCLLIFYRSKIGRRWVNIAGFIACLALMLLAGQQQETLAFIIALALVWACMQSQPNLGRIALLGFGIIFLATCVVAALGTEQLAKLTSEWGLTPGVNRIISARPVFYSDGIHLANGSFPLGIGLGKFGSIGAQIYDRSIYTSLGYNSFWWYRLDQFLLDTYWPNIFSETGWIGATFLLLTLLTLLVFSFRCWWTESNTLHKNVWGMACIGQLLALMTSLTAPVYGDPGLCAWLLVWLGIAMRTRTQKRELKNSAA